MTIISQGFSSASTARHNHLPAKLQIPLYLQFPILHSPVAWRDGRDLLLLQGSPSDNFAAEPTRKRYFLIYLKRS